MKYIDYEYYTALYGDDSLDENYFNRLAFDAERKIDNYTTGIDGVKKLRIAFPEDEDDAETIKRCICALIDLLYQIKESEKRISSGKGYTVNADGTLQGKVVTSVSSGNESMSFSSSASEKTLVDAVLADKTAQEKLYYDTVKEYLSGLTDANGVNLLYMGEYPYGVR